MALLCFFAPLVALSLAHTGLYDDHVVDAVLTGVEVVLESKVTSWKSKPLSEALLCKARERLDNWFEGGERQLEGGGVRDGIEVHFAGTAPCNGVETPVLFSKWSLMGVRPIHVFSALTNLEQQKWNTGLVRATPLEVGPAARKLQARGSRLEYAAGPALANRKVYEWEAFGKNEKGTEFWYVASSEHNKKLKELDPIKEGGGFMGMGGTVEIDSCLTAYHIREAQGGVQVSFTSCVNPHPPFGMSLQLISKMTWGKTVDVMKAVQGRALELAAQPDSQLWMPDSASFHDDQVSPQCSLTWDDAFRGLDSLVGMSELPSAGSRVSGNDDFWTSRNSAAAGAALLGVSLLTLVAFRIWSRPRYASLSKAGATFWATEAVATDVEAPWIE